MVHIYWGPKKALQEMQRAYLCISDEKVLRLIYRGISHENIAYLCDDSPRLPRQGLYAFFLERAKTGVFPEHPAQAIHLLKKPEPRQCKPLLHEICLGIACMRRTHDRHDASFL